ncbi:MAG: DNA topoisomerase IV subunit B [Culicoidibacterales bacterium]
MFVVANQKYSDDSIQILEGLDAVRKRPGMYIGSTDARGLHHLVYEIVDNAIDEVLAGFGQKILVTIHRDHSVSIEDFGRGIPVGKHASGASTAEVIFTILHAGGKFGGDSAYKTSGGLHGVGSSVVNALSSWMEVTIVRDKKTHVIRFEDGGRTNSGLQVIKDKPVKTSGTKVHFKPSPDVFSTIEYQFTTVAERLQESAFLLKGLKIVLNDERTDTKVEYLYEDGIVSYVDFLRGTKKALTIPFSFSQIIDEIEVDVALQYTDAYAEQMVSFVNNVRTRDGGTHETGFRSGLTKAINEYARKKILIKEKDKNLDGTDIREGVIVILSIRVPEKYLQFEGQTKAKLGTPQARSIVEQMIVEQMTYVLNENHKVAVDIIKKAQKAQQARDAARKARDEIRLGKNRSKKETNLSGKLTPAQSKDVTKTELFLVEGDSAGGSAKQGRDRKYQAILPLRGKVVNTERAKLADIFKNEEINTIIHTIGAGIGSDFVLKDCRYNRIVIMTDADTDGAHIQVLLLTFFFRYMRELVEAGKVYIALPPLYKVSKGQKPKERLEYAWTDEELQQILPSFGKGYIIQRYKGLGEMNADQLWETTMNPETRTFIRVAIEDAAEADKVISVLMGDKVEPRREWIESNVDFTLADDFKVD